MRILRSQGRSILEIAERSVRSFFFEHPMATYAAALAYRGLFPFVLMIVARLPELTVRSSGASRRSAGAVIRLPAGEGTPPRPSRRSWSTVPTRTATCSWSYAATSVATAPPESADPTGTSSFTREGSVRSSTSARPVTRRVHWSPSEQGPRGEGLPRTGSVRRTRRVGLDRLGPQAT